MFNLNIRKAVHVIFINNNDDIIDLVQTLRNDIFAKEQIFDVTSKPGCNQGVVPETFIALVKSCNVNKSDANLNATLITSDTNT